MDPGRDCHSCLVIFFSGSLGLEKLSGPKRSTSLLQRHMSQHESFRDYMYKSKHVCPTCAAVSLNEEGTKGKLWRLQGKSHNFQTVLQPEGKRAAGCKYVCAASQMKHVHPVITPGAPKPVCSTHWCLLFHGRHVTDVSMSMQFMQGIFKTLRSL